MSVGNAVRPRLWGRPHLSVLLFKKMALHFGLYIIRYPKQISNISDSHKTVQCYTQ